ncbi:hypothetical protein HGRIS_008623 [Hohenbuehelia grisea]|uniref:Uncharacterized protein n=1 Tax=Hohenbuehelia grisea TaxID=104357 RepID=A0ABR3J9K7_9AGAR
MPVGSLRSASGSALHISDEYGLAGPHRLATLCDFCALHEAFACYPSEPPEVIKDLSRYTFWKLCFAIATSQPSLYLYRIALSSIWKTRHRSNDAPGDTWPIICRYHFASTFLRSSLLDRQVTLQ